VLGSLSPGPLPRFLIPRALTISCSQMSRFERFDPEFSVVQELASKMPDVEAAKVLGVTMVTFYKARKKLGIPSYFEQTGKRKRKSGETYSFLDYNDRYFEIIDTPDKAYFLGLLAADGNISPRLTAARIALKEQDCNILEQFRKFLGEGAPELKTKISKINERNCAPQKILVLSKKSLVEDLLKLGITPNKSYTLKLSCNLREFKKDFLRGVWDGDGSVTERRFKVTTASLEFAYQLQTWILDVSGLSLPIKSELTKNGKDLYSIPGYIRDAKAIQAIYGGSSLGIERKLKAYEQYWEPRR